MKKSTPPLLVAIAGGSGAGKTRLAEQLCAALGRNAARVSLDDFYRDRSRVSPGRRSAINFDHPRAIDWRALELAIRDHRAGRTLRLPRYDFTTHCRIARRDSLPPKAVLILDGLWSFHRPWLRRLCHFLIFIDCPVRVRWKRRLKRDVEERGRTRNSVRRQLRETVEPMHVRFVEPQRRWAHIVLPGNFARRDAARIVKALAALIPCPRAPG